MKNVSKAQFTLIELLVVIAIIAILAAILLPALNSARERGIQTDCMSRQKSVGQAINMYRGEYNDMLVSQNNFAGKSSSNEDIGWISNLLKCKYLSNGATHEDAVSYMCPAEEALNGRDIQKGYGILSYIMYNAWSKRFYAINLKMQCIQKLGESKVLLVADSMGYKGTTIENSSRSLINFNGGSNWYGLPYARHNNTLNGLLLDGHVESVTGEQMYDKFRFIRTGWSSGKPPWAAMSKIPTYINQKKQIISLGSLSAEFEHNM